MDISSFDNIPISIPSQRAFDCEDCNKVFEESDSNDDGLLTAQELGAADSVNISAVASEQIETQQLQEEFLYNLDELKNGNISQEQFDDFLDEKGLKDFNLQEQQNESKENQINQSSNINIAAALYTLTNQTNNSDDNSLSNYADMMDKINEQTQSADVRDKLSIYTSNLRN